MIEESLAAAWEYIEFGVYRVKKLWLIVTFDELDLRFAW